MVISLLLHTVLCSSSEEITPPQSGVNTPAPVVVSQDLPRNEPIDITPIAIFKKDIDSTLYSKRQMITRRKISAGVFGFGVLPFISNYLAGSNTDAGHALNAGTGISESSRAALTSFIWAPGLLGSIIYQIRLMRVIPKKLVQINDDMKNYADQKVGEAEDIYKRRKTELLDLRNKLVEYDSDIDDIFPIFKWLRLDYSKEKQEDLQNDLEEQAKNEETNIGDAVIEIGGDVVRISERGKTPVVKSRKNSAVSIQMLDHLNDSINPSDGDKANEQQK